ncbi:hypothetical protein DCO58_09430 [Helicobacter saguini]|uniref:Uncharacterized protein n=1 Tax=Helicobacter saguini TaxID=1548018 RepID=A0A347VP92_9HELI|nr:hypothetical protein [Helicobacter saguini]MWV61461.1 hypothetical protein [Helicobacter saguini]MWV67867.1 hypothetical protein [Helicobacter saguini]MWV70663.1 hypothetical protein [Helicobacter saguini]MWV72568.1 hypothetical protein [Helicobacter saguini]TLD94697.1 hypothetical protein LS64_004015 [Helicobacter saguini]
MKDAITKLESILNQGLYGREEEVRLALLCVLSNKNLLLYGHDDALDILSRFQTLFGEVPITAKLSVSKKHTRKFDKYTAYCELGNHSNTEFLYQYLFTQKNTAVFETLKQVSPEAQKLKKFFDSYNFRQFWNDENKNHAINFIESLVINANPTGSNLDSKDDENSIAKELSNISDKRFKDFLHILAVNIIMNDRNTISPIDFGMFYYCMREWHDGVKYLENTICSSLSTEDLPTFVYHDEDYERNCKEEFAKKYESEHNLIPNVEFMFYVPYSSAPNKPQNDIFVRLNQFYTQYQNLNTQGNSSDLEDDLKLLKEKEKILKDAQLEEMELKESQLAQVQLKRSAFKPVEDGIKAKIKIASAKEHEFKEQRENLEAKYKDSKIKEQREGLESQIAEIKAQEAQFTEARLKLEDELKKARAGLEEKLKSTRDILESKLEEVKEKERDLQVVKERVDSALGNFKSDVSARVKESKDYLSSLRLLSGGLNKAIDACQKQIDSVSRPNPVWGNPLKAHLSALKRIQKNLPNLIKVFDAQIKKFEEQSAKIPKG